MEVSPRVGEGGDVTLNVSPEIIRKQLTIFGSWTVNNADMADRVRFVADHGVEVDDLFTDSWTYEQADEAYKSFDKQASGKGVFLN